jgi:hypothetical protein
VAAVELTEGLGLMCRGGQQLLVGLSVEVLDNWFLSRAAKL